MTNLEKAEELKAKDEFSMRSCWECNPAHKHLKKCGGLFICFGCGRWWMNGNYFTKKHCKKEFIEREPLKVICVTIKPNK